MINDNSNSDELVTQKKSAFCESYKSFYGGQKNDVLSSDGPIFHLLVSSISLIVIIIVMWLGGSFGPGILTDRTDTFIWPLLDLIVFFTIFITVTGFITGPIGLIWYYFLKRKEEN